MSINYGGRANPSVTSRENERAKALKSQEERKRKKLLREREAVRRCGGVVGLLGGGAAKEADRNGAGRGGFE